MNKKSMLAKDFPKKISKRFFPFLLLVLLGAALITVNWERLCFSKGQFDAKRNIKMGKRITYEYGLSEPKNDTTWIIDSLMYQEMGYEGRGAGCIIGSTFANYIDGYNSIYGPFLKASVLPEIEEKAKSILKTRPVNWKDGLTEDEKKMRMLVF